MAGPSAGLGSGRTPWTRRRRRGRLWRRPAPTPKEGSASGRSRPFTGGCVTGCAVEAHGFASQCIPSGKLSVFPGLDCDLGTIRLDHGRVFTGTVIDSDGTPLPGAAVIAESYWHLSGHTIGGRSSYTTLRTDANGRFRTPPLPVGHLMLAVRVPDRQLASVSPVYRTDQSGRGRGPGDDPTREGRTASRSS